jgi:micrococcal nuclease
MGVPVQLSQLLTSLLRSRPRSLVGVLVVLALGAYIVFSGSGNPPSTPRSNPGGTPSDIGAPEPDLGGESESTAAGTTQAVVLDVVDGDTIVALVDGVEERIRYIGIDTPETEKPDQPLECYADEATRRNEELVQGLTVSLEFDQELRDRFGRLLAYVEAAGRKVNEALIGEGFARTIVVEPNTARIDELARLEAEAGRAGLGLWGACNL